MTHSSGDAERSGQIPDEMAEYLQTFLDETEEQLEDLVETLLSLEADTTNATGLNEAFRLIHSIKGSAGMMGLDSITVLTHQLESRFERFRSGAEQLDDRTMSVVLRCIDFLRQCIQRLHSNQRLASPAELLDELSRLSEQDHDCSALPQSDSRTEVLPLHSESAAISQTVAQPSSGDPSNLLSPRDLQSSKPKFRLLVRFQSGLQLLDLKAQLILTRLSNLAEIYHIEPDIAGLAVSETADTFEIRFASEADEVQIRSLAEVDGVTSIELDFDGENEVGVRTVSESLADSRSPAQTAELSPSIPEAATNVSEIAEALPSESERTVNESTSAKAAGKIPTPYHSLREGDEGIQSQDPQTEVEHEIDVNESSAAESQTPAIPASARTDNVAPDSASLAETDKSEAVTDASSGNGVGVGPTKNRSAATMRVDIERLDKLMNLTGELVVNKARFQQVIGALDPAWRKSGMLNRIRDFKDLLRDTLESFQDGRSGQGRQAASIQGLEDGVRMLQEQCEILENGRRCFDRLSEAMDQLSLVSHSLQRGLLDTRMVPIAPLFNRFKRVVRDLSKDRGQEVRLEIHGEKTELDKRMIDELGDPLVHLIRNSIDHGMEAAEERLRLKKPVIGTIELEARHSGNNVFIYVRDDGRGIDLEKIKDKVVAKGILPRSGLSDMSDDQILDFIWHPGFSTAERVSEVSGRGVGMDVVRNRISSLNGTVEVSTSPGRGTTFALRMPLTLAIIESLLVRMRNTVFAIPIDDVREIVSFAKGEVITTNAQRSFELRGEYIPLVRIEDVFTWNEKDSAEGEAKAVASNGQAKSKLSVVVLQVSGKTLGMQVEELLGSQDIVVKSLSDNLTDIRGLAGASILGDARVCLMLDVGAIMEIALRVERTTTVEATLA